MRQIAAIASLLPLLGFPAIGGIGTTIPRSGPPILQTPPAQDTMLADAQQALDKKDFARAAQLLAEYLKTHPGDANIHFQLALSYDSLKRTDDAIPEYRRAIALNPTLFPAQMNLGLALIDRKDYASAASAFQRAAELVPDQAKPRYYAGLALERGGDLKGAAAQYEHAASLDDKSADTLFHWGTTLLRLGRADEAELHLRQGLALRPDNGPAHLALANALLVQKKNDAAITELNAYLQRVPGDTEARMQLAETLYESGKTAEALAELDRADAAGTTNAEHAKLRVAILISQEKWDAATQALAPLMRAAPNDASLHAELGNILLEKRDFPAAESELRRALALGDTKVETMRHLMSTVYLAGKYPAALDLLDKLAQREPPNAFVFFVRATCYDKVDRKAEAVDAYRKFLAAEQTENRKNDKEEFQATERLKLLLRELSKK